MSAARARLLPTLGAYLALAFSALTVLLTLVVTVVIEHTASADVATSIGANLAELATQTTSRIDRGMYERYREIQLMADRLARIEDPVQMRAELNAARDTYRFYSWLGVADPKGVVQVASGGLLEGQDVSHRPWFPQALAGVHLGDVHTAELLGKLLGQEGLGPPRFYDVAFPLLRKDGSIAGVLAAHVSWDWAKDVRAAVFGLGRRGEVAPLIVATDGTVLLGPADVENRKLDLASLRQAAAGRSGYLRETWPDGEDYVVGYAKSQGFLGAPSLGWRVLVRQDVDSANEPVRQLKWRVFFGGIALAIVFSALGWLGSRMISQPLLRLAADARRLEQGGPVQVQPSHAYREVQDLGTALNAMVGRLQGQRSELAALNSELEQRVEQRTAELRKAFERVQANEQRTQTILEAAQDPFIGIDLDGAIIDWNSRAEVVFGWAREEVLGRKLADLLLPERFRASLEAMLQQFRRTGDAAILNRPIERLLVTRDGRELPFEVRIGLVSTGEHRFFSAFVHDISHRKEVERMKDEFISTVSHELRTPLTATYGSLSLLASGMAGELPPDAKQLLSISHESTERLIRLINDLLDLEKIASGKIEYRMVPQPLRPLVEQAVRDTRAYAEGLRVTLELEPGPDGRVLCDSDRIVQVCVNLLSNAAKFSPAGGTASVALRVQANWLRVSVVDHGPGVPPEFADRMFQRFAQADSSDRRTKGGTGLGLAICRSIVEAHGGRMGFASEPQVRTEFWFELPLA